MEYDIITTLHDVADGECYSRAGEVLCTPDPRIEIRTPYAGPLYTSSGGDGRVAAGSNWNQDIANGNAMVPHAGGNTNLRDLEEDLRPESAMVTRDPYDNRVVVALWTVQLVTVVFMAVFTIWVTCNNDMIHDTHAGLRIAATALLTPLLLYPLILECKRYFQRSLSTAIYLRLQIIKTMLWTSLLYIILATVSGVGEEGVQIFRDAAKKLILPFLASLAYSVFVHWRDRAVKKKMARLVEAVAAMQTKLTDDGHVQRDESDKYDGDEPSR